MVAEGKLDEAVGLTAASGLRSYPLKRAYWATAGVKTFTGAALAFLGAGFAGVCGSYAEFPWACTASRWAVAAGILLAGVGLADGGTRAPWPEGTPKEKP
jgi:hypothetical protein